MKKTPFVSVIVPIYNEEKYLGKCINALIGQSYPKERYEILFIDDESEDRSSEICKRTIQISKLPLMKYVLVKHCGLSTVRNTGIYLAKGDIIAFIDGDAVADNNWISEIVKAFCSEERIGVIGGRIEVLNDEKFIPNFIHIARYSQLFGPRVFKNNIIGTNMAYRREVFEKKGGFYEEFTERGDETSLITQVLSEYQFSGAPYAIVYHEHPESFVLWLKREYKEGYLSHLCNKIKYANWRMNLRRKFSYVEKLAIILWPFLGVISLFLHSPVRLILFAITSIFIVRRYIWKLEQRSIYSKLMNKFKNIGIIPFFIFLNWISISVWCAGFLKGCFLTRGSSLNSTRISGKRIVKIISNRKTK